MTTTVIYGQLLSFFCIILMPLSYQTSIFLSFDAMDSSATSFYHISAHFILYFSHSPKHTLSPIQTCLLLHSFCTSPLHEEATCLQTPPPCYITYIFNPYFFSKFQSLLPAPHPQLLPRSLISYLFSISYKLSNNFFYNNFFPISFHILCLDLSYL